MKLRDLKPATLKKLARRGHRDYKAWKKSYPNPKTELQVWEWAFSRGVSAALESSEIVTQIIKSGEVGK